jgi:hypothetical protein
MWCFEEKAKIAARLKGCQAIAQAKILMRSRLSFAVAFTLATNDK